MVSAAGSCPPEEVLAPPRKTEDYLCWRATTDLRAPYRIAPEFLHGTKLDAEFDTDEVPLIVFINARSGGRVGPELAAVLARAVGSSQVFDLSEYRPDKVLAQIWRNLQQQEQRGNVRAGLVRSRLRILACGGDGTVAWVLKVIHQLDLQPQPAVAIMPLGTGNDLSRTFHWGPLFEHGWIKGHASVYSTLKRVADAKVSNLDCWRLRLLLPNSTFKPAKTYAMEEVAAADAAAAAGQPPSSQHQQGGCAGESSSVIMEGMFWNYFSVGADAQAAYNFHHLRDNHPMLASNRLANQFWYSTFSCTSGWFCGALPSVSRFGKVEVLQPGSSSWSELQIPSTVKALVLVNLQSYAGGRNIWGEQQPKVQGRWKQPSVSDGLIEIVGFHSGYHAMAIMASGAKLANGKRLAQVGGIRLALQDPLARPDGEPSQVFMQLDGEPWLQKVPAGSAGSHVTLEVVHAGVSKLLSNVTHPDRHPESKMEELLGEQQTAAYLTAAAEPNQAPAAIELQHTQQQQQPTALDAHVAAAAQPATASAAAAGCHPGLLPPAAAQTGTAAAAAASSTAASVVRDSKGRLVHTDGGAPCSSTPLTVPPTSTHRTSLDVQPVPHQEEASSSSGSRAGPSPVSSNGAEAPTAVAVIEARPVPAEGSKNQHKVLSGAEHGKQQGGVEVVGDQQSATLPAKRSMLPTFFQTSRKV